MKTLIFKTKKRVFGSLSGRHLSKFKGEGIDFKEIREYTYGEDAKKIDWKISAKLQKPVIKEFEESRELNIMILYLISGSMHFGSIRLKSETALETIAALGFSAIKDDDRVNVVCFDKKPLHFKPTKSINTLSGVLENINNIKLLKKDYDFSFIDYLNRFKKSLLFVIGDFYKIPPLHKLKHETYAIIIRDKFEENPEFRGFVELINPMDLKEYEASFSSRSVKKYKNFIQNQDKELFGYLNSKRIKNSKIYTDEDVFYKLKEMLK